MANHSKLVGTVTSKYVLSNYSQISSVHEIDPFNLNSYLENNKDNNKSEIQQDLINFALHSIDIGHAAKPFEVELKWADLVTMEFLNQGDTEKNLGLPISFLCDRATSNVPASQVGFIAGIVLPTFQLLTCILPDSQHYLTLIEKAKIEWEKLKEIKANETTNQ